MGTTVPGGRYLTSDGRVVDANGHPLDPDTTPAQGDAGTPLPDAFPHHEALLGAGLGTLELVKAASDAELLAIPTVGKAAVRAIRAAE